MKRCVMKQNVIGTGSSREEIRSSVPVSLMVTDQRETMICPKPRRFGIFNDQPVRSLRWQFSHQVELCDSRPGSDVLDMILSKGGYGVEEVCARVASPSPFFCGSPPSRVANPLIQDARFGDEDIITAVSALPPIRAPLSLSSPIPSSGSRKGSCVWANFGNKPAVRVEGFDCLDRDRRNCSIPALA